jgi:hypothetical protein
LLKNGAFRCSGYFFQGLFQQPFLKKGVNKEIMEVIHIPGATHLRSRKAKGLWVTPTFMFYDESGK